MAFRMSATHCRAWCPDNPETTDTFEVTLASPGDPGLVGRVPIRSLRLAVSGS